MSYNVTKKKYISLHYIKEPAVPEGNQIVDEGEVSFLRLLLSNEGVVNGISHFVMNSWIQ